jgi:hypothetical protein
MIVCGILKLPKMAKINEAGYSASMVVAAARFAACCALLKRAR